MLKVISNFVQVGVLPFTVANMLVQGQWDAYPRNHQHRHHHRLQLADARPAHLVRPDPQLGPHGHPAPCPRYGRHGGGFAASHEAAAAADTPTDNVLTRGLLGLWDISLWINNSGQTAPLPPGFTAATYTSVLKVISNFVQVGVLPFTVANMAVQGQWDEIPATINTAITTAFNSLTQGLPNSFTQTLNWVLTGATPSTTTAVKTTENSLFKASRRARPRGRMSSARSTTARRRQSTTTGMARLPGEHDDRMQPTKPVMARQAGSAGHDAGCMPTKAGDQPAKPGDGTEPPAA